MTQAEQKFNPSEHLIQLKSREGSKDYLPVQFRLVWFREACPQGTIDTEEMEVDLDREVEEEVYVWNNEKRRSEKVVKRAKGYARYKAIVTDGKGGRATGTKSENAASFPDFAEKAETGAIGRALAGLGYGTQFAPELNEMPRSVDSPVERSEPATNDSHQPAQPTPRPTAQSMNVANDPINNGQLRGIEDLLIHKLQRPFAREEYLGLTSMQASGLIQQLTSEWNVARQSKANNRAQVGAK